MKLKYRIWFEKDEDSVFGEGRYQLLKAIDECHSLNAATKKLNMAYRAAWGKLKTTEARLGIKLLNKDSQTGGLYLTQEGKDMMGIYEKLDKEFHTISEYIENKFLK